MASQRRRDWMSWRMLASGAAIAVAAGVVGSYVYRDPAAVAMLTGDRAVAPVVVAPRNETLAAGDLQFEWKGVDEVRLVVIDLSAEDRRILDRTVAGSPYVPTADERRALTSGHQYQWYVETQSGDGRGMTSGAGRFAIR